MTDLIARKHASLIDRLYDKTEEKAIEWDYDETRGEVTAEVGSYKVSLVAGTNSNGSPVEVVKIKDWSSNRIIESFNDEDLYNLNTGATAYDSYWEKMEALRSSAYRQAVGAEQAVNEILKELGDDTWGDV